jgi:hypothetical protein
LRDLRQIRQYKEDSMRRASSFKKRDVTRAAKAVQAAGLDIALVEVSRDGLIRIVPGQPGGVCIPVQPNARDQVYNEPWNGRAVPADDLDRELAEFNTRHDKD